MVLLRKLVNALILFLNLIVSGLFIFSAYSDHISPVSFLYPSYFGILFPFFFVLLLFFLFFWLVRMKWLVLLPILTLLICWEPVTRYCPLHIMPEKEPVESIKFLTYNTCAMGRNAFWNENEGNNVINFIKEQDADIVCLQEYLYYKNKGKLTESIIKKQLKDYPYYHYSKASKSHTSGLAIFSKYPIKKVKDIDYNSLYNASCLYELDVDGKTVTVINNHLESNKLSKEDKEFYLEIMNHFDSEKIDIFRSTLMTKLGDAYKIRAAQADTLKKIISNIETPLIVCGDFNDTPISYCYKTIRGNMKDAFKESGLGFGISYHENKFLFRIDHIFYNNKIESYRAKVHKVTYSDHYPVTVYMKIND